MVRVRVLGRCEVETDGVCLALRFRQAELVGLLALRKEAVARATTASLLWPEAEPTAARHNLRQTLLALRNAGVRCIDSQGEFLRLVGACVDLWELEERLKRPVEPERIPELLPGVESDWVLPARESFSRLVVGVALRGGEAALPEEPERALAFADMALAQDRWLEASRGLRIRALVGMGERPRAEREVEAFEREVGMASRLRPLLDRAAPDSLAGLGVSSLNPHERVRLLTAAAPGLPSGGRAALSQALAAAPRLGSADRLRAEAVLASLSLEEGQVAAAESLARGVLAGDDLPAARLALARVLIRTGRLVEAEAQLDGDPDDPELRAGWEIARGVVLHLRHDLSEAERTFRRALELAEAVPCRRLAAKARFGIAAAATWAGKREAALRELSAGLEAASDGLPGERARFEMALGRLREDEGHWVEAHAAYAQAADAARRLDDAWTLAQALTYLGDLSARRGKRSAAVGFYREAIVLRRGIGDRLGLATALKGLGVAQGEEGESALRESLEVYLACGDPLAGAAALMPLARLLRGSGRLEEALAYARKASESLRRMKAHPAGLATDGTFSPEAAQALLTELEDLAKMRDS